MDLSNSNDLCQLCFCCKYVELESMKNVEVTKKIEKYLQIKMEYSSSVICQNCYNALEGFHEFYEKVHTAQLNFQKNIHSTQVVTEVQTKQLEEISTTKENSHDEISLILNTNIDNKLNEAIELRDLDVQKQSEDLEIEKKVSDNGTSDDTLIQNNSQSYKKFKQSKVKKVSSEIENKMLEFYNIKCEKCDDCKFTSFKMLSKHYKTVHNTQGYIKCCKRNIRVNDKYYLRNHMFKHLQPDTCRCNICGKELSSLATLKHHMILHKPTEERPFQCKECSKRFCCKNDLKNHEKALHIPEDEREGYICDVCGKVFQKVANLRYHHSTVHLQERKYICELCAKSFTTQSGLRTHINAAHSTLDPIQCHECNKWLKTKDTFQKHLQLHQNNTYPCSHCDKVCKSSSSLRSHLVKHSKERPYTCSICRKSFKTKTHLKNHSTQHLGGSNYKCPYCSKLFVNMSNYYTHRKRMHGTEKTNKIYKKPVEKEDVYQNSQQPNVCAENISFDYKLGKNDLQNFNGSVISDVMTVRQNIIISPVKYL